MLRSLKKSPPAMFQLELPSAETITQLSSATFRLAGKGTARHT